MAAKEAQNFIKQITLKLICFLVVMVGLLSAGQIQATTLYLSPSFGSSSVGKTFAVTVYVSSKDTAINAASGVVSFPNDKLELVSLTKTGSIFNLWVAEPSFSQSAGTFSFEGIILNPGYTGTAGKIIWANFKIKAPGSAQLSFASGAILANDGQGTNVLSGFGSATFNLVGDGAFKPAIPAVETAKPAATAPNQPFKSSIIKPTQLSVAAAATPVPQISSETNPDQNKWYANNRARLSWPVPSQVTAVRLSLSSAPNNIPTVTYAPPINSKELVDLADGLYYFSARFKDSSGWGNTVRYILRIDTTLPEALIINSVSGTTTIDLRPKLQLATVDHVSGINYYLVKINDEPAITVKPEELVAGVYTLPAQIPGVKNIIIEAYDRAGNKVFATVKLEVLQGAVGSKWLTLTDYPERIKVGDTLIIRGKTSGVNKVTVYWQKVNEAAVKTMASGLFDNFSLADTVDKPVAHKVIEVISDLKGSFALAMPVREPGDYQAWAEIKDDNGLTIASSDKVSIVAYQGIASVIFNILKQLWWLLILIALSALVYAYWKSPVLRGRRQNHRYISRVLYNSLHLLRDGIKAQIRILIGAKAKRRLSREETAVMFGLKKTLSNTDRFLAKEITLIKKRKKK